MNRLYPNRIRELLLAIDDQGRQEAARVTDALRAALEADDREQERSR